MWQKNNGQNEAEVLQNRFTAYLSSAIIRRRKEYILQAVRRQQAESLMEKPIFVPADNMERQILEELPLLMRLENDTLLYALKELNERERHVFLSRVLDEKSFEELAMELSLTYKGVAAVYYRAIRKIRNKMKEAEYEF